MSEPSEGLIGLLNAVGRQDKDAFITLYKATASRLYGIILRIVRSREDAADVLQDVYLQLWSNASSFSQEKGDALSWMITIARYRALDLVRSGHARAGRKMEDLKVAERMSIEAEAETSIAEKQMLRRYLDVLDEETRAMVVLAYCYGYSREELAERFKQPVNTIKTHLHRAMLKLRAQKSNGDTL